ncbi:MAG: ATP-dependent DNA helicase UvrD2 [Acidimicrobiales bacterium]
MAVPGPAALGRSVMVLAGQAVPAPWAAAPRVVIDTAVVAAPADAIAELHRLWAGREPAVVELAVDPSTFREPRGELLEPWMAGPGYEPGLDRLHFLVWANTYDARAGGEPLWWWTRKAARLGASAEGPADIRLANGDPAWLDGGPRTPFPTPLDGARVVHRDTIELGRLDPQPAPRPPTVALAPDQLEAVSHGAGPARIIAPAGSGKTRVLTERLRELVGARGYEREIVLAVAYNRKAQQEMAERTPELGARVQTLNAWGYGLIARWLGRRPQVLDDREVRTLVEGLVPRQQRRVNTDPLAPYLDGLSLIRLGLRDPEEVEDAIEDAPGLAAAFGPYRAELRRRGGVDFDEQVYLAAEALISDGAFRRAVQADHRHLLVDELQDLTPAHVLLVRLATCPTFDVFGVGDDDQTIYGHAGADPRFLIGFADWFPGAGAHALEVNYRCAAPITQAAARLLSYNHHRVGKDIRPGPNVPISVDALAVRTPPSDQGAEVLVEIVAGWLGEGVEASTLAVLTRVNSLLLAPHVALAEAGVALDSTLSPDVLGRLGARAALAYLRIAVAPDDLDPTDLLEVHRRPSRGLPQWAEKWLGRCRSVDAVRAAGARIDDARVGNKLDDLADDLERLARLGRRGATTRELLLAVRDDIGLGSAMTLLDSSGGATGSHLDDLEGLVQVADLHPEAASFEPWLRRALHQERDDSGVTLSTVHRVKGREWDRVAVFGVTDGIVPHRLAGDIEEERRVLHVAITRGRERVVVIGDGGRPSRFLAELDGTAPHRALARSAESSAERTRARPSKPVARGPEVVEAQAGMVVGVLGGYEGVVAAVDGEGVRLALADGGSLFVRHGERIRLDGRSVVLAPPPSPHAQAALTALRAWRTARAKADAVPAYVVLSDKYLDGIVARYPDTLEALRACPGIGPARLESYGEEILAILVAAAAR